ncbi:hypothetical protein ACF0H5_003893 [Mactra antiquata]
MTTNPQSQVGQFCVPCGSNYECLPQKNFCDEICDCSSCEDELFCGEVTKKNRRLFDASCDVQLIQATSTQTTTERSTSTFTTTVTSVKVIKGTASVTSRITSFAAFTFIETRHLVRFVRPQIIENMNTLCSIAAANAMAAAAISFRLEPITRTTTSFLTFSASCTPTTFFPLNK